MSPKISIFSMLLLSTTLFSTPIIAHAELSIANNTDFDSTCVVNDGMCSSELGDEGITHGHSQNVISQLQLLIACGSNTSACKADVYLTNDCSGPKIGTVILDVYAGITQITSPGPYKITSTNPFEVQLDPA